MKDPTPTTEQHLLQFGPIIQAFAHQESLILHIMAHISGAAANDLLAAHAAAG